MKNITKGRGGKFEIIPGVDLTDQNLYISGEPTKKYISTMSFPQEVFLYIKNDTGSSIRYTIAAMARGSDKGTYNLTVKYNDKTLQDSYNQDTDSEYNWNVQGAASHPFIVSQGGIFAADQKSIFEYFGLKGISEIDSTMEFELNIQIDRFYAEYNTYWGGMEYTSKFNVTPYTTPGQFLLTVEGIQIIEDTGNHLVQIRELMYDEIEDLVLPCYIIGTLDTQEYTDETEISVNELLYFESNDMTTINPLNN